MSEPADDGAERADDMTAEAIAEELPGAKVIEMATRQGMQAKARAERERKRREQDAERRKLAPTLDDLEDWTEARLATTVFPPVKWLVQDTIPVGVWLCSAHPKIGKSLLMTGLCRAVVTGTMFCNYRSTTRCAALYLDLEGKPRRAQARQLKVRGAHDVGSDDFHSYFAWPNMDQNGMALLEEAVKRWNLGLIVIDVWVGFRPHRGKGEDAYTYDYRSLQPLLELAAKHEITIILVHHNRKQADGDWMAEASGSTGLTGGVDGTMSIRRQRGEDLATLSISGRDVDEQELAMRFSGGLWTVLGDAKDFFAGENRREIHGVLSLPQNAKGLSLKDIIEDSGVNRRVAQRILKQMVHEGALRCPKRGYYVLAKPADPSLI